MKIPDTVRDLVIEILLKEPLQQIYNHCKQYLKVKDKILDFDQNYFTESLTQNLTKTINWSNNIYFSGLVSEKKTEEKYIALDFYLTPLRETYKTPDIQENLLEEVFDITTKHIIIQGEGGSGKSTSMQMLCRKILTDEAYLPQYSFPLVLRLREHNESFRSLSKEKIAIRERAVTEDGKVHDYVKEENTYNGNLLFWELYKELGLQFSNKTQVDKRLELFKNVNSGFLKKYLFYILEFLKPVIIIDGFDEIDFELRSHIFKEINELCLGLANSRVIVTSRTGEFEYTISNAHKFQIAPLSNEKIKLFCNAWLKDDYKGNILYNEIKSSPFYDTTIRPINLTLLATLFEANGSLPPKPRSAYRDIIDLQINKWDRIRNINRVSNVSNFDPSIKFEFLSHLAFFLSKDNLVVFDKGNLEFIYRKRLSSRFSLDPDQFDKVINEIETHSGIFIQSARDQYEFPHKSIQEYLTGEYISRYQPLEDLGDIIANLPNELAIATSLSNNPGHLLIQARKFLIRGLGYITESYLIYIKRLITEKVDFLPTRALGQEMLILWKDLFSQTDELKKEYERFSCLNGLKESVVVKDFPNYRNF